MSADNERTNPFVGLRPFFDEDAFYFFGRGEQTSDLLQLLHAHRFVPVLGSSGSGKSSLVRAGLIPLLQGGFLVSERDGWRMAKCRPGEAPLENLAEALQYAMGEGRAPAAAALLAQRMREEHTDAIVEYVRPRLKGTENLFILVDQFEELFAFRSAAGGDGDDEPGTTPDAERIAERIRRRQDASSLVSLLLALSRQKELPVYVSITMRTDFLGDCDLFEGLPEAINASGYLVPRLTRKQLRECVVGPARLHGAQVAPRLADRVLNDVGDRGDQLPVLQHALLRTWERWEAGGRVGPLDLVHFEQAGGLDGALAQQADEITASADPVMVERIFKRLTTTDARRRRVRSPARLSELISVSGAPPDAVKALLARCVAEGVNFLYAAPDGKPGDPRYDIVHESLIRQWPTLRAWVDEERDLRDWWVEMTRRAAADAASPGEDLLSPRAVQQAEERLAKRSVTEAWAARYAGQGIPFGDTMAYLVRSRDAVAGRRLRRIQVIGGTVLCFVVLGVYGAYNGWLADRTLDAARDSSRRVAIERLAIEDPTYATALAAEFTREELEDPATMALAQRALAGAVATLELEHIGPVAISDDGTQLATAAADTVVLRRTDGTGARSVVLGQSSAATVLRFTRDGSAVLVGSLDGKVRRIGVGDGRVQKVWTVSKGWLITVLESPDGSHLVALDGGGSLYAWSSTAAQVASLPLSEVTVADFVPTERATLVVGTRLSGKKLVRMPLTERASPQAVVVDSTALSGGAPIMLVFSPTEDAFLVGWDNFRTSLYVKGKRPVNLDSSMVSTAAYSPDGQFLAIGTAVGTVELYDARTLTRRWRLAPHTQYVSVGFSMNSDAVVSMSYDRTGQWTSISDSSSFVRLHGHRDDPSTLLMAPKGRPFVTQDVGGVVRVWEPPNDVGNFHPPVDSIVDVALSEDGRVVLTGFADGGVLAQFPANDRPPLLMPGSDRLLQRVGAIALAPDGSRAFVGLDGGAEPLLWNLSTANPMPLPLGDRDHIIKASFSSDGRTLVVALSDGRVLRRDGVRGTARDEVTRCDPSEVAGQIAVSPDGRRVAVWCEGAPMVTIVTPDDTLEQSTFDIAPVRTMRFSPDTTSLLIAGMGYDKLLVDTRARDRYRILSSQQPESYSVAFSRDGRLIATAGYDKTVEVFAVPPDSTDAAYLEPFARLTGHRAPVLHVAFSPADQTIVSTGRDGSVHVWQPKGDDYVRVALPHPQPLPPSAFVEQVASAMLGTQRLVASVALSFQGDANGERAYTVARYRRWSLSPDSLAARLRQRNSVCVPLAIRESLIPVERDVAAARSADCRQRIGRAAK
jgi:WD40 repeat protein